MSSESHPIPIHLLTGFLGSGKTTLLNALLKSPAFANTAVIVNEFGEIGLDHFLIEQSQDNVVLLDAGCLCCTISESLHETLAELHAKRVRGEVPPFERVIVETTGLADPGPILNTLLGHRLVTAHYRLEAAIVTVDTQHVSALIDEQPEVARQIAVADRLVLTKTDLADDTEAIRSRLRALNAWAPLVVSVSGTAALEAFAPLDRYRLARIPGGRYGHEHSHAKGRCLAAQGELCRLLRVDVPGVQQIQLRAAVVIQGQVLLIRQTRNRIFGGEAGDIESRPHRVLECLG